MSGKVLPARLLGSIRFPIILLTLLGVVLGLWAGLSLMGWPLPSPFPGFMEFHGPIMTNGVLATLIGLERAVSLRRFPPYFAPAASVSGSVLLLFDVPWPLVAALWVAGSATLALVFLHIFRLQPSIHTAMMALSTILLLFGNIVWWATSTIPPVVLWWAAFLVLVIAAERLELTRILPMTRAKKVLFASGSAVLFAAPAVGMLAYSYGNIAAAIGTILVAAWLLRYDMARMNVRTPGRPRFIAVSLISGYLWLLLAGVIALLGEGALPGLYYDAFLHSIFIGFVFTMIIAHSQVIMSAFLGREIRFTKFYYASLAFVEVALASRVYSDMAGWENLRMVSGAMNVAAIALFGATLAATIVLDKLSWFRALLHLNFMNAQ